MNIFQIEDADVKHAVSMLGHSLKYICKTKKRAKGCIYAIGYYHEYIMAFQKLCDTTKEAEALICKAHPTRFMSAMVTDNEELIDLDDIVHELLNVVAHYLSNKSGKTQKVAFLPFYFEQSFQNFNGYQYGEYVRDCLMRELHYEAKELCEMTISVSVEIAKGKES